MHPAVHTAYQLTSSTQLDGVLLALAKGGYMAGSTIADQDPAPTVIVDHPSEDLRRVDQLVLAADPGAERT